MATDQFGITKIYETIASGREWFSTWNNGRARSWGNDTNDPDDMQFWTKYKGDGAWTTDGQGILKISGSGPRMHIVNSYDHQGDPSNVNNFYGAWHNVEITVYGMRVSDNGTAWGGLVAMARTNHMIDLNKCDTRGIDARIRYDGHIDFEKETSHTASIAVQNKELWSGGMPYNVWIGYKLIIYDLPDGNVKLELWYDLTDGRDGGAWAKINEMTDTGSNFGTGGTACKSGISPGLKLTASDTRQGSETNMPNLTVYYRSDGVNTNGLWYKKASIREITTGAAPPCPIPEYKLTLTTN